MKKILFTLIVGIVLGLFFRDLLIDKPVSAKLVTIRSRGLEYQVATRARTVEELLEEQGFQGSVIARTPSGVEGDEAIPETRLPDGQVAARLAERERGRALPPVARNDNLVNGIIISVANPLSITLLDGGSTPLTVTTTAETVSDLLHEQKIGLSRTDQVSIRLSPFPHPSHQGRGIENKFLPLDSRRYVGVEGGGGVGVNFLAHGMEVKIDRIVDLEITETNDILFDIFMEHDPSSYYGREEIREQGVVGKKQQKFLITYKNGVEVKRKLLAEKIVAEPKTELRRVGTRIEVELTENGRASWYAYKACLCAAHPYYEKGRFVRVTRAGGKSIIVKINDRGPDLSIHPDRVIDLDSAAFKELAPLGAGTIAVKAELLK